LTGTGVKGAGKSKKKNNPEKRTEERKKIENPSRTGQGPGRGGPKERCKSKKKTRLRDRPWGKGGEGKLVRVWKRRNQNQLQNNPRVSAAQHRRTWGDCGKPTSDEEKVKWQVTGNDQTGVEETSDLG